MTVGLLFCAGSAHALTDEDLFRDFRFQFGAPGARATALGGAFVGIADDATASVANPAGLTALKTAQFFVDVRYAGDDGADTVESSVGSLTVNPVTGERDLPYLRLTSQGQTDTSIVPDFIAFAWPFELGSKGRRLVVSGSRQVILSVDREAEGTESRFAFDTFPNTVSDTGDVVAYSVAAPVTGSSATNVVYWSASAAFQVHQDFSVGATVSYANLDIEANSSTQVNDPLQLFLDPTHPRLPSQPALDFYQTAVDGTDTGFAYSLGVQWNPVSSFGGAVAPWRFGAVYGKGVEFGVPETTTLNGLPGPSFENVIVVPDRYAVGASYALGTRWLFALQLERIEYSDQLDGFQSGVNFFTSARVADEAYTIDPAKTVTFDVDDGTFVRIGTEYLLSLGQGKQDLAVRAGYYRSPDDRIRMTEFNSTDAGVNEMYISAFPPGSAENHFTAGVGYALGSSSFHLAVDAADSGTQIVASYVLTFGTKKKRVSG